MFQEHLNNPCEVQNQDIWTFERNDPSNFDGIKEFARYEERSGCCKKLGSTLKRNKLHLIMELMKHSLGTPIPDDRLDKSFNEFSLVWPTEDVKRKIEMK